MDLETLVDTDRATRSGFLNLDAAVVVALVTAAPALLLSWPSIAAALCALALVATTMALLTAALAPRPVGALIRGVVCGAATLVLSVVLGLVLNLFSTGLSRRNLLLSLLVIALVSYVVARGRWAGRPLRAALAALRLRAGTLSDRLQIAAAVVLIVIGGAFTVATMHVRDSVAFAELGLTANSPVAGVVEVRNQLDVRQDFVVVVTGGPTPAQFTISLDPGQTWSEPVETNATTRAQLYLGTTTDQPYRTVWLAR